MYKNINVYEIQELCGKGAYGSVYLAKNSISQQRIALKVLSGKQQKRELEGLIRYRDIRHPNLMQIYHVDRTTDGELFYTMQLADNFNHQESPYIPDTLGHRLAQQERINPHELINIILELLDGLEVLHNAGFSHRDIKSLSTNNLIYFSIMLYYIKNKIGIIYVNAKNENMGSFR